MQEASIDSDKKYLQYLWKSYFTKSQQRPQSSFSTSNLSHSLARPLTSTLPHPPHAPLPPSSYTKSSPLHHLRSMLQSNRSLSKLQKLKYKSRSYLQQKLDDNINVFMNGNEIDKKDIQDILWEKNYLLKSSINELKEENNNVKAKVWNYEKENRKMQRQIEGWGLERGLLVEGRGGKGKGMTSKPYLDSNTMDKVYKDQDYSVVTMKIHLAQLTNDLQAKDQQIKKNNHILQQSKHFEELINGQISLEAKKLIKYITTDNTSSLEELKKINEKVKENNQRIVLLEEELGLIRQGYDRYKREKEGLERPVEEEIDLYKDLKKKGEFKVQRREEKEGCSRLRSEVDHQKEVIDDLEYKIQEVINESLTQKQGLRKKIKELQKRIMGEGEREDELDQ